MIKEKVSLSQTVRLITWIVIPIIVIFGLLIPIRDFMHATNPTAQALCGFVILIVLLSLCSIMLYAPKEITLDDSALTLARGKGKLRIKLADIEEVQRYDRAARAISAYSASAGYTAMWDAITTATSATTHRM